MTNANDTNRAAFEAWAGNNNCVLELDGDSHYWDHTTNKAWLAWQAVRAILATQADHIADASKMVTQPLIAEAARDGQEKMDTDESREYLRTFMYANFSDTTFSNYIRKELAGDFAYQMANAIAAVKRDDVAGDAARFRALDVYSRRHKTVGYAINIGGSFEWTSLADFADRQIAIQDAAIAASKEPT